MPSKCCGAEAFRLLVRAEPDGRVAPLGECRWIERLLLASPQLAARVRAVWPQYPIQEHVAFHANASGPLSSLDTELELKVRDTLVTARGAGRAESGFTIGHVSSLRGLHGDVRVFGR